MATTKFESGYSKL